jgi:hypothetical protein
MGSVCSTNGAKRNAYRILVRKAGKKETIRRTRHRWVDNIKVDLREVGWGGMEWIDAAQDIDQWRTIVNRGMKLRVS